MGSGVEFFIFLLTCVSYTYCPPRHADVTAHMTWICFLTFQSLVSPFKVGIIMPSLLLGHYMFVKHLAQFFEQRYTQKIQTIIITIVRMYA